MARKDRTFTDEDILRFITRNLDRREQVSILDFFGLQDVPAPLVPRLREIQGKIASARKTLRALIQEIDVLEDLVGSLALLPGPQKPLLLKAKKIIDVSLTVLRGLDTLLS